MSQTLTELDLDFEILEMLDFENDIPCDWPAHRHEAQWFGQRSCCGQGDFLCESARQQWLATFTPEMHWKCKFCQAKLYIDSAEWIPAKNWKG
jgi:hypothetical protein